MWKSVGSCNAVGVTTKDLPEIDISKLKAAGLARSLPIYIRPIYTYKKGNFGMFGAGQNSAHKS